MQGNPELDPYFLQRFLLAQEGVYPGVVSELKAGQKHTHWMWFIFPQADGLGMSETTRFYAVKSRAEAKAFLAHPVLGARLLECTSLLLLQKDRTAHQIFGSPDEFKLQSCMTLFSAVSDDPKMFERVLARYYNGQPDMRTIEILENWRSQAKSPSGTIS